MSDVTSIKTTNLKSITDEFKRVHGKKAFNEFVIGTVNQRVQDIEYNRQASPVLIAFIAATILKKDETTLNTLLGEFHAKASPEGAGNNGNYSEATLSELKAIVEEEVRGFKPEDYDPPQNTFDKVA